MSGTTANPCVRTQGCCKYSVNADAALGWHAWHGRRQKEDESDSKTVTVLLRNGGHGHLHLDWRSLIDGRVPRLWTAMGPTMHDGHLGLKISDATIHWSPLAAGFPGRDPSTPDHSRQIELDGSDGCSESDHRPREGTECIWSNVAGRLDYEPSPTVTRQYTIATHECL